MNRNVFLENIVSIFTEFTLLFAQLFFMAGFIFTISYGIGQWGVPFIVTFFLYLILSGIVFYYFVFFKNKKMDNISKILFLILSYSMVVVVPYFELAKWVKEESLFNLLSKFLAELFIIFMIAYFVLLLFSSYNISMKIKSQKN